MQCISISVMLFSEVITDSRLVWLSAAALFGFFSLFEFSFICQWVSSTESADIFLRVILLKATQLMWWYALYNVVVQFGIGQKILPKTGDDGILQLMKALSCLSWIKNVSVSVPVQYLCGTFAEPFEVAKAFQARQSTDTAQLF